MPKYYLKYDRTDASHSLDTLQQQGFTCLANLEFGERDETKLRRYTLTDYSRFNVTINGQSLSELVKQNRSTGDTVSNDLQTLRRALMAQVGDDSVVDTLLLSLNQYGFGALMQTDLQRMALDYGGYGINCSEPVITIMCNPSPDGNTVPLHIVCSSQTTQIVSPDDEELAVSAEPPLLLYQADFQIGMNGQIELEKFVISSNCTTPLAALPQALLEQHRRQLQNLICQTLKTALEQLTVDDSGQALRWLSKSLFTGISLFDTIPTNWLEIIKVAADQLAAVEQKNHPTFSDFYSDIKQVITLLDSDILYIIKASDEKHKPMLTRRMEQFNSAISDIENNYVRKYQDNKKQQSVYHPKPTSVNEFLQLQADSPKPVTTAQPSTVNR